MNKSDLKDKIAIIIGMGGIGREIAVVFDKIQVKLVLADIDNTELEKIKNEIKQDPIIYSCDITKPEDVKNLIATSIKKYGKIDILINTVGIIIPNLFENITYQEINKQINVNLIGAITCIKEIIPIMKEQGSGTIITISSLAGIVPETYSSIYTATKFALRGLNFTLNLELDKENIHVATIFPDSVNTPMLEYEARHGGSPLTFLHEPIEPKKVVKAVIKAILKKKVEVCVPHFDGILSKIIMAFPSQVKRIWPKYEKKGEVKRKEFLKNLNEKENSTKSID